MTSKLRKKVKMKRRERQQQQSITKIKTLN